MDADRDGMETVLTQAQQWLLAQDEASQATPLLQGFALLVNGGLSGLETEQATMETAVTGFAQIVSGRRALDEGWKTYQANAQKVADGRQQLEASAPELEAARRELEDGWKQYNDGVAKYESGKRELADGRRQLEEGWATLTDKQLELEDARRQIADAKAELADARAELDEARQTIDENAQKLRDGEIEYEDARAEAEQELADARAKIEDGQKELDDIEMPEWYVWDRSNNVSYSSFTGNVDKLTAITTIFPVFFFLVAALVVSTTMTRMVVEERLQIGTLKALGYTRREIMRKYLWYALVAAVCGTAVGLTVGFRAFPAIIWSAYAMMYYMPAIYTPWRGLQALFAGGTLTVLSVGVTALACRTSLQEVPAALMLPRAPKAGKRILLERITPLWRRLPFTWKVTCRNLLRYKKRVLDDGHRCGGLHVAAGVWLRHLGFPERHHHQAVQRCLPLRPDDGGHQGGGHRTGGGLRLSVQQRAVHRIHDGGRPEHPAVHPRRGGGRLPDGAPGCDTVRRLPGSARAYQPYPHASG